MAVCPAAPMKSGVPKSGSPAPKSITSTPSRRSRSTVAVTFMVGEPAMRAVRSARRVIPASLSALDLITQALFNHVGHQSVHTAAEREDFLDKAGADAGRLLRRHHENGLDSTIQPPMHQRHLKFELKVGDGAYAAHERLGTASLHVSDKPP